ncbi:helix-turn-helix domain-containing protein [Seongchinamella sediminis]|uniref:Helix-turn-helix domain-containing protein n=1 Tax=Seongchinamella sediminis TaxID=2283635 RepID=A0A3L7DUX6_9GAMM|nr:AraC family transcriptional regulator [Seongchinamella sediminis]RLQ20319.1 helix-turn-helix domain-containing protein [Seongchinamella sediminis]
MLSDSYPSTRGYNDSVPREFTRALLLKAQAHGKDVEAMLRAAGFPFDPLRQCAQTSLVSPQQYSRLCVELVRALNDESAGVMPDVQTPVGTTRLILLTMLNSSSLAVALRRAIEFNAACRLRQGGEVSNELTIDADGKFATLSYLCRGDVPGVQHSVLCSLAMWMRFCGWLVGQQIDISEARCAGPEPEFTAGVRHFFPCPVRFGQQLNSVTFSARLLEAEPLRDEAELRAFLKLAPYHVIIEPSAGTLSVTQRIRTILGSDFRTEMPSFDELTGLLNMSARTLRRRLEKEGTSYQRIKDNARRDAAISLLSREGMTVSEVAERVGFSDPSAFHRSFKKWTGLSPGSYR